MREVIQCLIDWLKDNPSETKAHRILSALANESLKKADLAEELSRFDSMDIAVAANEKKENTSEANDWIDWKRTVWKYWQARENQIIDLAKKRDLKFYPKPDRISTAGGPDLTTYLIKAEPLPAEIRNVDWSSQFEAYLGNYHFLAAYRRVLATLDSRKLACSVNPQTSYNKGIKHVFEYVYHP